MKFKYLSIVCILCILSCNSNTVNLFHGSLIFFCLLEKAISYFQLKAFSRATIFEMFFSPLHLIFCSSSGEMFFVCDFWWKCTLPLATKSKNEEWNTWTASFILLIPLYYLGIYFLPDSDVLLVNCIVYLAVIFLFFYCFYKDPISIRIILWLLIFKARYEYSRNLKLGSNVDEFCLF